MKCKWESAQLFYLRWDEMREGKRENREREREREGSQVIDKEKVVYEY